jgi:putative transcriptional regulator
LLRLNYDRTVRPIPEGRPIDALLAAYTAKTLAPAQAALVAAHLDLKPASRAFVAALEAVQGVFLQELKPIPLAGRDRRLVNIFASSGPEAPPLAPLGPAAPAAPRGPAGQDTAVVPRALRNLAGCDFADLPWRKGGAGIRQVLLPDDGCGTACFISVAPGMRLPIARDGEETTAALVLAGAASGPSGYYGRGDIVFAGPDGAPTVEGDIDCVCFMVDELPAKTAPGRLSRVLNVVIGG